MKRHYENAPEYDADAYRTRDYDGVAWYVLGWETEPTEDTEWDGIEVRTGKLVMRMIGDDRHFTYSPEDIEPLAREEYCSECGQIGCCHDGYDREPTLHKFTVIWKFEVDAENAQDAGWKAWDRMKHPESPITFDVYDSDNNHTYVDMERM